MVVTFSKVNEEKRISKAFNTTTASRKQSQNKELEEKYKSSMRHYNKIQFSFCYSYYTCLTSLLFLITCLSYLSRTFQSLSTTGLSYIL